MTRIPGVLDTRNRWWPAARLQDSRIDRLEPGNLVVFERKPWRILSLAAVPTEKWPEQYENGWQAWHEQWRQALAEGRQWAAKAEPQRETWDGRPVTAIVRLATTENDPRPKDGEALGRASDHVWLLPEHYAICRLCHEIPPCRHEFDERRISEEMAETTRLMAIPRGCCLACGEPITNRQKAQRFPGPNLWRPDHGDNTAVFHARSACGDRLSLYRQQWTARGGTSQQPTLTD